MYVHMYAHTVGFYFFIGFGVNAQLQGKECLYLVTFIVPEFPQAFSSGFLNSFIQQINNSHILFNNTFFIS